MFFKKQIETVNDSNITKSKIPFIYFLKNDYALVVVLFIVLFLTAGLLWFYITQTKHTPIVDKQGTVTSLAIDTEINGIYIKPESLNTEMIRQVLDTVGLTSDNLYFDFNSLDHVNPLKVTVTFKDIRKINSEVQKSLSMIVRGKEGELVKGITSEFSSESRYLNYNVYNNPDIFPNQEDNNVSRILSLDLIQVLYYASLKTGNGDIYKPSQIASEILGTENVLFEVEVDSDVLFNFENTTSIFLKVLSLFNPPEVSAQSCGGYYTCGSATSTCTCSISGGSCSVGGSVCASGGGICGCTFDACHEEDPAVPKSCVGLPEIECRSSSHGCATSQCTAYNGCTWGGSGTPPPADGCGVISGTPPSSWQCGGACNGGYECKKVDDEPWCKCLSTSCNTNVTGRVVLDQNNNGVRDAGDVLIERPGKDCGSALNIDGVEIHYASEINSGALLYNTHCDSDFSPYYEFNIGSGGYYNFRIPGYIIRDTWGNIGEACSLNANGSVFCNIAGCTNNNEIYFLISNAPPAPVCESYETVQLARSTASETCTYPAWTSTPKPPACYTSNPTVNVRSNAPTALEMRFVEKSISTNCGTVSDSDPGWSSWQGYNSSVSFSLNSTLGDKQLCAQYRSCPSQGCWSETCGSTITYETCSIQIASPLPNLVAGTSSIVTVSSIPSYLATNNLLRTTFSSTNPSVATVCDPAIYPLNCPSTSSFSSYLDTNTPYRARVTAVSAGDINIVTTATVPSHGIICQSDLEPLTTLNPSPWWQAKYGSIISAIGSVSSPISPDTPEENRFLVLSSIIAPIFDPGVVIAGQDISVEPPNAYSVEEWNSKSPNSANVNLSKFISYDEFNNKIENLNKISIGPNISSTELQSGTAQKGYFVYEYTGSSTLSINGDVNIPAGRKVIIVVPNASVNITGNINVVKGQSFFMLITRNNISVLPAVTNLEGIYFAERNFNVLKSTSGADVPLNIRGSVAAAMSSSYSVNLERDLEAGNVTAPSETFEYAADQILMMPSFFSEIPVTWQEVSP